LAAESPTARARTLLTVRGWIGWTACTTLVLGVGAAEIFNDPRGGDVPVLALVLLALTGGALAALKGPGALLYVAALLLILGIAAGAGPCRQGFECETGKAALVTTFYLGPVAMLAALGGLLGRWFSHRADRSASP
jgi:hypothetical protein